MRVALLSVWFFFLLPSLLLPANETKASPSPPPPPYSQSARAKFQAKFTSTCSKYPFVAQFADMMQRPRDRYVIYVFHEAGNGNGGLGDRLGGMITALAFALRFDRQFLVLGDGPFTQAFAPYNSNATAAALNTWASWDWAGWQSDFTANMTYNRHCVNPKPRGTVCALDHDQPFKVVKFRGNRAYLCRWAVKPSLGLQPSLLARLGVSASTDLYEVAGCMLRLAMWPTELLWRTLDVMLAEQLASTSFPATAAPAAQVGFHFRCGDSSFGAGAAKEINGECVYSPTAQWNGTTFFDDISRDSPLDLAACGRQVLAALSSPSASSASLALPAVPVLAYIASDYPPSAAQINQSLHWPHVVAPPGACHVDLQRGNTATAALGCTLSTTAQWLMLSLSDTIVMQSLQTNYQSVYKPKSPETASLPAPPEELGPISAFSRYAAIYALSPDVMRYGLNCTAVNKTVLSRQTMGNWVCDPKMFH